MARSAGDNVVRSIQVGESLVGRVTRTRLRTICIFLTMERVYAKAFFRYKLHRLPHRVP